MSTVAAPGTLNPLDPLAANLKGAYLFNEGSGSIVHDRTTNANNAITSLEAGATATWVTNDPSQSIALDLVSVGVPGDTTANATLLAPNDIGVNDGETYTVVGAFKLPTYDINNGSYGCVWQKLQTGNLYPWSLIVDYGALGFGVGFVVLQVATTALSKISCPSISAFNDGNWHQFIASRTQGGIIKLYVDGVLQSTATDTFSAGATINAQDITWAAPTTGDSRGGIVEVSYSYIYNTQFSDGGISAGNPALSGSQIYDIFHNPTRMWVGANPMPIVGPAPSFQFNTLGVSQILLGPRIVGASLAVWLAANNYTTLRRPQSMDFDQKVKTADSFGGESQWQRDAYNYETSVSTKITYQKGDLSAFYFTLNGDLTVQAPTGFVEQLPNEQQIYIPQLSLTPDYFTVVAQSTFGDKQLNLVFPKTKLSGGITANLDRTKITDLVLDTLANWDDSYVTTENQVGGIYELFWIGGGGSVPIS